MRHRGADPGSNVTYRLPVRLLLSIVLVLGAALAAGSSAAGSRTASLTLDGVPFRPELALTPSQREVGLMRRAKAPGEGMLFVFPSATTAGFWMKNTLVPLTIVFFDTSGARVRRLSMSPCRVDPCPVYYPRRRYRFALELPVSDTRRVRALGPRAGLRRLLRQSR
jgi:uncharacterized protein